mmetsp:Transcript_91417/g.258876  ORF Transcript_91417/g.258876 Transcript_91417/m.258876 type:complete len:86 (+) Transcript_91417:65-322(+)
MDLNVSMPKIITSNNATRFTFMTKAGGKCPCCLQQPVMVTGGRWWKMGWHLVALGFCWQPVGWVWRVAWLVGQNRDAQPPQSHRS